MLRWLLDHSECRKVPWLGIYCFQVGTKEFRANKDFSKEEDIYWSSLSFYKWFIILTDSCGQRHNYTMKIFLYKEYKTKRKKKITMLHVQFLVLVNI